MKTIQLNICNYNELDKQGKAKAIEHFRDINLICDWWEPVYDDFVAICGYIGITVPKNTIAFHGFYFQGSGSGFYGEVNLGTLVEQIPVCSWTTHAPELELTLSLPEIDNRVLDLAISKKLELNPCIIRRNRCYGVVADLGGFPFEIGRREHNLICGEVEELEKWLQGVGNTLNALLFQLLEDEFDNLSEDTAIAETIIANEYLFTADGTFARQIEKMALNL